jgi:hypothetical protein
VRTQADIEDLVKRQPDPRIFFKIFLELGTKCMLPFLAFDQRSVKDLLDDKNDEYFNPNFPLFYLNKARKSALDIALELD